MGNVCPNGFQNSPASPVMCTVECPSTQGFDSRNVNGEPLCVYRDRPEVRLLLKQAPALQIKQGDPIPTLQQLQTSNPSIYAKFKEIKDDFDTKFPLVTAQVTRDLQIADAFRAMQAAENVRDQSPQAYQDARNRYYTLVRGQDWIGEESQRIANAEVLPKLGQYSQIKTDLTTRLNQQQQTIDVVNSVKDKVLSMRDDFAYTTNTFAKQISDLKNQINIERKRAEVQKVEMFSWVDMFLNILITVLTLGLLVLIIRKFISKYKTQTYTFKPEYQ